MAGGRPKKVIDYDMVKKLAHIHCTQQEIANILEVSVDTLQRDEEFCGIYKKAMDDAKASLRRLQFRKAESGNPTMLIWLGKQYLGQTDKQDIKHSGGLSVYADMTDEELDDEIRKLEQGG